MTIDEQAVLVAGLIKLSELIFLMVVAVLNFGWLNGMSLVAVIHLLMPKS